MVSEDPRASSPRVTARPARRATVLRKCRGSDHDGRSPVLVQLCAEPADSYRRTTSGAASAALLAQHLVADEGGDSADHPA
jgi:hypothetical protein